MTPINPSSAQRRLAYLLVLLAASLVLALLMRGGAALARYTFQSQANTPPATSTGVPQPTATLVPPAATPTSVVVPTGLPTEELPELPTDTPEATQQTDTPAVPPTARVVLTATVVPPTTTLLPTPTVAPPNPTLPPTQPPTQPLPTPLPTEPEPAAQPQVAQPEREEDATVALVKSLVIAGGYFWLCCGVLFVLFIPVGLLWLNRRGKRRVRGL